MLRSSWTTVPGQPSQCTVAPAFPECSWACDLRVLQQLVLSSHNKVPVLLSLCVLSYVLEGQLVHGWGVVRATCPGAAEGPWLGFGESLSLGQPPSQPSPAPAPAPAPSPESSLRTPLSSSCLLQGRVWLAVSTCCMSGAVGGSGAGGIIYDSVLVGSARHCLPAWSPLARTPFRTQTEECKLVLSGSGRPALEPGAAIPSLVGTPAQSTPRAEVGAGQGCSRAVRQSPGARQALSTDPSPPLRGHAR